MSNLAIKDFFKRDDVNGKFRELLGNRAAGFVASVLQVAQSNDYLKNADPVTIFNAAATAAILELPINNNLGFAYIVPYKGSAQFQLGYKGFIQLAQRSGQFKTISATPIYEGQIIESNPLTGYKFDFTVIPTENTKVVGYAAYFELLNGFQKTLYMTADEVKLHGKKYSQTFKKNTGIWQDNFEAMALKTVIKLLLSKFAPLSIEMQRAVVSDQSVVRNYETLEVEYPDNGEEVIEVDDLRELLDLKRDVLSIEQLKEANRIINGNEVESFKKLQELLKSK